MVVSASKGNSIKANINNFGCFAGARSLGIVELDDWYTSGHYYGNCGLYEDYPTARKVTEYISKINHKAYGVEVRPLEDFESPPHTVIVLSNPFNVMRLVQGYTYKNGTHFNYKFIGNQAMCGELTAHPYSTNDINVSLLCAGVRKKGVGNDEIGVGIPLSKFMDMVDGLCKTITAVETNVRKREIEENLNNMSVKDVEVEYNKNYGDGMHKHDFEYFLGNR